MNLALKQMLLGTGMGRVAQAVRNRYRLLKTPFAALGTEVNDQMAARLAILLCPEGGTFVDVGAHIGSVMADVAFLRPKVRLIAFEAVPERARALARKFPGAAVHCCALSDTEGPRSFFINVEHPGFSSLSDNGGAVRQIEVEARRLDSMLPAEYADVVKVDVEGMELGVFMGAEAFLTRCRPILMFESGPGVSAGYMKEALFDWFAQRGYGIFAPNRIANTGSSMCLSTFLYSHEYPRWTTNYFALPMERFDAIRERARSVAD